MPTKPISASKTAVQNTMKAFEKALKQATKADGSVDMKSLRAEAKKVSGDQELHAVFEKSIDVLEKSFERRKTVNGSCGSSIVKEAPASLSAKEVKSVFAALVEAKGKGLDKIDSRGKKDNIITPAEAKGAAGPELSDKLAAAAARAVTHASDTKPRRPAGGGGGGSVGC